MLTFSHSGTTGDVFNSLSVVRALGGGHLYLKLNNLEAMVREKLGWGDVGVHRGRMTQHDFEAMREFILHQPYITGFTVWAGEPVDYDLDEAARHHETGVFPRNFANQYARALNMDLDANLKALQIEAYMECREAVKIPGRPFVVFRGSRYQEGNAVESPQWRSWLDWGLAEQAVFIGLEADHTWFTSSMGVDIPHYITPTFMDMARVIQGSEMLITSMSSPCAVGLALGKTMWIETRKNETLERLEVNYPWRPNIFYF